MIVVIGEGEGVWEGNMVMTVTVMSNDQCSYLYDVRIHVRLGVPSWLLNVLSVLLVLFRCATPTMQNVRKRINVPW